MIISVHFDKLFSFQVLIAARALCTMKGTKNTFLKSKQISESLFARRTKNFLFKFFFALQAYLTIFDPNFLVNLFLGYLIVTDKTCLK